MEITTQYDIHQIVWVIDKETNKVINRKVADIIVTVIGSDLSKPFINIEYALDFRLPHNPMRNVKNYNEKECFSAKQALLDSLWTHLNEQYVISEDDMEVVEYDLEHFLSHYPIDATLQNVAYGSEQKLSN